MGCRPICLQKKYSFPIIKSFMKEMGYLKKNAINQDPRHVISNRRQALKRKPFEHDEVVGLAEAANWSDYPHETQKDTDMQEASTSSVK